jgi:AcrR family transcriptional regulator
MPRNVHRLQCCSQRKILPSLPAVHEAAGLRERKKTETRRAIADAALALATERGPNDLTVDDIAAAAGVSPRTVFNYFASKEEAILGVDPDRRRALLERLEARPTGEPPLEALRMAFQESTGDGAGAVAWRARARLARDHPQLNAAYLASFASLEDELTAALAGRLDVDGAADPLPRLAVTIALTAMRVAVDHALAAGRSEPADLAAAVDAAFAAVAGGLAPAPRRSP